MLIPSTNPLLKIRNWAPEQINYQPQSHMWFASARLLRWVSATSLYVAAITCGIYFFIQHHDLSLGFGATNARSLLGMSSSLLSTVLIANSPQLLLSYLYFAYNGLYSCMLLAEEWSQHAYRQRPLRVTSPKGTQRSTYRLQLPYRYSISLMIYSSLLHWLVSQSLFLVILNAYDTMGNRDRDNDIMTCGYSPSAILVTLILGALSTIVALGFGC